MGAGPAGPGPFIGATFIGEEGHQRLHGLKDGAAALAASLAGVGDQSGPRQAGHMVRQGGLGNCEPGPDVAEGETAGPRPDEQSVNAEPGGAAQFGQAPGRPFLVHVFAVHGPSVGAAAGFVND